MTLSPLIERVEAASGKDRKLDQDIFVWANPFSVPAKSYPMVSISHNKSVIVPKYTASLDAVIALCERVLPGWIETCHTADESAEEYPIKLEVVYRYGGGEQPEAAVELSYQHPSIDPIYISGAAAATPALALLLALLRAKQSMETER